MTKPITLEDIRREAQALANARNDISATAALFNAEAKAAVEPIYARYKPTLDQYAAAEATAMERLDDLLVVAPHLFLKPRSLKVDGVSCGYKKDTDSLDWKDEAAVIAAIKAFFPALAATLIRTQESLVIDALDGLDPADRVKVGIQTITGADKRYIKIGENDVEKLAKMLIADAARRQGEDDASVEKTGKVKVRAKVAA